MNRCIIASFALLVASACTADVPGEVYGERPTLRDTTLVSVVMDSAHSWEGRRVLVAGMVVAVCEKRGCWLQLASDREHQTLKVKVEDGVIIFPMAARGRRAVVEGIVEAVVLTADEARQQARRHAEEMGEPFDSTRTFTASTTHQLRGIGAIVLD